MSAQASILREMRTVLAALAPSRDATALFKEHLTNDPFRESALAGRDAFYIESLAAKQTAAFGIVGTKEMDWRVDVLIGHAPFEQDYLREEHVARDISRIKDILEMRIWTFTGVSVVWPVGEEETSREDPNWWISRIPFRVIYTEAIATS